MDAIILCSGFATRLGPMGEVIPKMFLDINEKPVIDYIFESIEKTSGVDRVIVTSNKKFARKYRDWVVQKRRAGTSKKLRLVVEPVMRNEDRLGAVGSMLNAIKKEGVKKDLLVVLGDNFFTFDMPQILKEFISEREPALVAYDIRSLQEAKRFGVIHAERGLIKSFEEKPKRPKSTLISTGIYFYPKESLNLIPTYVKETGQTDAVGNLIRWLVGHTDVRVVVPKEGEWIDIGNVRGYLRARFLMHEYLMATTKPRK